MGSLYSKATPIVPVEHYSEEQHRRLLAEGVNRALSGNLNNVSASLRLRHNLSSTTVSDHRAGPESLISFMPLNLTGSFAMSRYWIDGQGDGIFVINHISTSTSDATVKYAIFG